MSRRPKAKYPQGEKTKGKIQVEVTLHFTLYPAGWAGNDSQVFNWAYRALTALIDLPIWHFKIEEQVRIGAIRWRRPGETWQRWKGPVR